MRKNLSTTKKKLLTQAMKLASEGFDVYYIADKLKVPTRFILTNAGQLLIRQLQINHAMRKNPFPLDNTLPDDFKPNISKWKFKLNIKGESDDVWRKLELFVDDGILRIDEKEPFEHPYYAVADVEKLLSDPSYAILIYKVGPSSDVIVGTIKEKQKKAIVREIIEKGMKQEGYKQKKNPIKPNKTQVEWAHSSNEGIAFYDIDPLEFLRLTAESPEHFHRLLKEAKPMEFYNSPEVQKELIVHPFIAVDDQGKIDAHEGRHRAASTYNAGEKTYRIAIVAEERGWPVKTHGWRWKRRLKVPPQLIAQYPGMDRYTHQVDPTKLEEIPTYYQVDKEDDVRTTRKKKNPVKLPKLDFEEIE